MLTSFENYILVWCRFFLSSTFVMVLLSSSYPSTLFSKKKGPFGRLDLSCGSCVAHDCDHFAIASHPSCYLCYQSKRVDKEPFQRVKDWFLIVATSEVRVRE